VAVLIGSQLRHRRRDGRRRRISRRIERPTLR
jgi:hypothetical protein